MRKAMLFLAVLGLAGSLWAADAFVGTWKLNPVKSKADLKSFTMTTEAQGNGFKSVQDLVDLEGKVTHRSWTIKYDGKAGRLSPGCCQRCCQTASQGLYNEVELW